MQLVQVLTSARLCASSSSNIRGGCFCVNSDGLITSSTAKPLVSLLASQLIGCTHVLTEHSSSAAPSVSFNLHID